MSLRALKRFWGRSPLIVMIIVMLALATGIWSSARLSGDVPTTTKSGPQFGIQIGGALINLSQAQLEERLQGAKKLGVTWIRFDLDWNVVQRSDATTYDWRGYDRVITAIKASGLHALGTLDYSPRWARGSYYSRQNVQTRPANTAAYATFAGAAVARYAPQGLHYWEIWNEPNLPKFWQPRPDASSYSTLLRAAYVSIHKYDPLAVVVTGGLSSTATGSVNLSAVDFLQGMYAAGDKDYFDAVAMHPYTYPSSPSDSQRARGWQELYQMHSIMDAHGDGAKKIWITEYGAPTGGFWQAAVVSGGGTQHSRIDHVTEALQAQLVTDAVRQYNTLPWAGPFFWYDYADNTQVTKSPENFYGLVRTDGSEKPAFAAYQRAIAASK